MAATKAAVIPVDLYIHSGETCHASAVRKNRARASDRDDGFIYNDGFIFINKDNRETRMQDGKQAEKILEAEIKEYASYLGGDVHSVSIAYFDPATLEWTDDDYEDNIFGSSRAEAWENIFGSSLEETLTGNGFNIDERLDSVQVQLLENSVTPEYKNAAGKEYIEAVKKELPDFDGNIKAAATSVSKQWGALAKAIPGTRQQPNRYELKKQALSEYLKDMGCDSPGKTFAFLEEKTGIKNPEIEHERKNSGKKTRNAEILRSR